MIGSHNTFTYLKSTNSLYNTMTSLWRCQDKTLAEQLASGVRYFDVRVKLEVKSGKNMWRVCHGDAKLNKVFVSLKSICELFKGYEVFYRIILEDNDDKEVFLNEIAPLCEEYEGLVYVAIKKPWTEIYVSPKFSAAMHDYSYVPWNTGESVWYNITHFKFSSIKSWAKKHNPEITEEMLNDEKNIYFMDYV